MAERFNIAELRQLASDVGVDYEELDAETKGEVALELLRYCERYGKLDALLSAVRSARPGAFGSREPQPEPPAADTLPPELRRDLRDRRLTLSRGQSDLLYVVEQSGTGGVAQDKIERAFTRFTAGEIFYRLEHLRLLGFVEREAIADGKLPRFRYRLTQRYADVLAQLKT